MSDNGPQFSPANFRDFATEWMLTSSPHYPQSNEKAENVVKNCEAPFQQVSRCREIRVPSIIKLEKHTNRGHGNQPSPTLSWVAMQNFIANFYCFIAAKFPSTEVYTARSTSRYEVQLWQLFTCLDYTNFSHFQTSQFW